MVIKGTLENIGEVSFEKGMNYAALLKINGKQYNNVAYSNYLKGFLNVGSELELSLQPGSGLQSFSRIWAIRTNGEVIEDNLGNKSAFIGLGMLILALPAIIFGVMLSVYADSSALGWLGGIAIWFGIPVFFTNKRFESLEKFRNALR